MVATRSRILGFFILFVAALLMASCGGDATYSPITTGTSSPAKVGLTISPNPAAIWPTGTVNFTATVTGTSNNNVSWKILNSTGETGNGIGTLNPTGANTASYSAPSFEDAKPKKRGGPTGLTVTIQATSQADKTVTATDTITVTDLLVKITPNDPTVTEGKTQQFTATVTLLGQKISDQTVNWYVNGGVPGSINQTTGLFSAGYQPGETNILAYAGVYNGDMGTAEANTFAPPGISVTVAPTPITVFTGNGGTTFTATVKGSTNQAVTWSIADTSYYGTFDATTGTYTPPSSFPEGVTQAVQHVQATSVADPTKFAIATVTIDQTEDLPAKH